VKRLNPRAIWLFFISYLIRLGIIPIAFGFYLISLLPAGSEVLSGAFYSTILISIVVNIVLWVLLSLLWAWLTQHFFRYTLADNYFQKEVGVLYKKSITIPYENIQNIEIDQGLLLRVLGLSEIRIETAGAHARGEGRLPGLTRKEAEALKEELVRRAHAAKVK
jgi:uncharacterized membrane protein YdbT with pleckstrin-like domain